MIPTLFHDNRGWFYEYYNEREFSKIGIPTRFVQDNQSFTRKGCVRGLHLQRPPAAQAKLVSVISGRIIDVVVDVREGSVTFGQYYMCELDSEQHKMLYVPEGFAHGFAALEDTIFFYKCSDFYRKECETGIKWNDPALAIPWPIDNPVISAKDQELPSLEEFLRKSVI
ncbi:MAG TPA: dTDP-4-dehydrorhamnose 3,5-epimerase [Cyclobacteriaceae bacterium]